MLAMVTAWRWWLIMSVAKLTSAALCAVSEVGLLDMAEDGMAPPFMLMLMLMLGVVVTVTVVPDGAMLIEAIVVGVAEAAAGWLEELDPQPARTMAATVATAVVERTRTAVIAEGAFQVSGN